MRKLRNVTVAAMMATWMLSGALVPAAFAQSINCGPYQDQPCPVPEVPEEPEGVLEEEPEVFGEAVDLPAEEETEEETVAVRDTEPTEADVEALGVLARTGIDAWFLALVGVLALSAGILALRFRRNSSDVSH